MSMNCWTEIRDKYILLFQLNASWKKIVTIQLIGYVLAIVMAPATICIFVRDLPEVRSWFSIPIISFIVWGIFIVLPVVYAFIKRIEHRDVCFKVLWIPPVIAFFICTVSLLINILPLL